MNSYSISPIESAFNSGEFSLVLDLIKSFKNNNKDIKPITNLELSYFECRTYERFGDWNKSWEIYYKAEKYTIEDIDEDPKAKLILLVMKLYLLWRTSKLAEGIDEVTKNDKFISDLESNFNTIKNAEHFNFENWLGLYFIIISNFYLLTGDLDQAWVQNERSYYYYSKIKYDVYISKIIANFGEIHVLRGELDQALNKYRETVQLSRKNNDPITTIEGLYNIGNINYLLEKIDIAFSFYQESMKIALNINNIVYLAKIYYKMMIIYYNLGKKDDIKIILKSIEELNNDQNKNKYIEKILNIGTALNHLLSGSLKDTVTAQKILLRIYKEPVIDFDSYFFVMILLTEISLLEFQIYNSKTILDELVNYISDMLNLATKNNSTRLIIETRLLQAKIEIINGNLDRGEKLIIQAQFNAKEKRLNVLLTKINKEYDRFKGQISKWRNLINTNASVAERLEFSEINSYIKELRTKVLK